jgi:gas vesicle protein
MKKKHIFSSLLAGLAVGGALGVLLAPKSGKETRKDLEKHAKKISKNIAERLADALDVTQDRYMTIVEQAVDTYERVQDLSKEQIESLKKSFQKKWESITSQDQKNLK